MLTVLNLIILIALLGMALLWATYGFYSAFLQLMIVIIAGTFAFAIWEPVSYILLGRMPALAWGIGLLAPFALLLIIMRVLFDKFCKANLKFPRLADQLGGAACGLAAGVLTMGILLIGVGFLPMKSDIMGFQPYRMARNTVEENEDGRLWAFLRVDEWAGGFFTTLSTGAMSPMGGTPLAHYKLDIAKRSHVFHLTNDPFQSKVAPPEAIDLLAAHAVEADVFLDMVVYASFERLVTDQFDLDSVEDPGPYGEGYAEAIMVEYGRRLEAYEDLPDEEKNADTRPTALFNIAAMTELAELFAGPAEGGGSGGASRGGGSRGGGARGGGGRGRGRGIVPVPGEEPEEPTTEPEGNDDNENDSDAAPAAGVASVQALRDPGAFFDMVIEKQVRPTVQALDREIGQGGSVVMIDTQWKKDPPGAFDSDGWLRIALPAIRLITSQTTGDDTTYQDLPAVAYSLEVDQNNGNRLLVDLINQTYYSAYSQNNNVKIGWVFIVPAGQQPFRFVARELGFDLSEPLAVNPPASFYEVADAIGAVDVPEQTPPPPGIQVGESNAVVDLSANLPRSLSPNAATEIESDRESEPWTAFKGRQTNIRRSQGGRRSQMRAVFVPQGAGMIRVIVDSTADQNLLAQPRQERLQLLVRDDKGVEHDAIGYALLKEDDSQDIDLRTQSSYSANDLPRVGSQDQLYIYFQVPLGVNVTDLVFGSPDGERIPFEESLLIE